MSSNSARLGSSPLSDTDSLIRRGLLIIAPSQLNPNVSQPFGPSQPEGYEFETRAPSLLVGQGLAIFFIAVFTSARLYTRSCRTRQFCMDDWMVIPGALGAIVYLSLSLVSSTKGCLGKHLYDCTYSEVYWYMRTAQVQQPLFYFCVFCIKLSITLANKRITGLSSERWIRTHRMFTALFVILLPLTVCLEAFQCIPVPARYSLIYIGSMADPHDIKCLDARAVSLSTRIIHILTDVALLCVPIIIVLRLRMIPRRKKARLIFVFALGGMSTIASILRNRIITRYLDDITWQYYEIYVWNTIDICFAVIVASLPALNSVLDAGIVRVRQYASHHSSGHRFLSDSEQSTDRRNVHRRSLKVDLGVISHSHSDKEQISMFTLDNKESMTGEMKSADYRTLEDSIVTDP